MRKRDLFVLSKPSGDFYVMAAAVMSPLCILTDGLPVAFFGRGRKAYIKVDTALEWCKKEMERHSRQKYTEIIAVLEKAKAQVAKDAS